MLACHYKRVEDQFNVDLSMCEGLNHVIYLYKI